ncbi:hypothetical protein EMIHUDRAFT_461383, partial [Emiliania huxleyi CCMP1516]|uniref:Uncharacterized protein n=2 Tax=Emiliania huxleyi TaxID=2903 RepID=A0A0D3J414_EMIH1
WPLERACCCSSSPPPLPPPSASRRAASLATRSSRSSTGSQSLCSPTPADSRCSTRETGSTSPSSTRTHATPRLRWLRQSTRTPRSASGCSRQGSEAHSASPSTADARCSCRAGPTSLRPRRCLRSSLAAQRLGARWARCRSSGAARCGSRSTTSRGRWTRGRHSPPPQGRTTPLRAGSCWKLARLAASLSSWSQDELTALSCSCRRAAPLGSAPSCKAAAPPPLCRRQEVSWRRALAREQGL